MLAGLTLTEVFWFACAGLALDVTFGEPRRAHPLVAFGRMADWIESRLNRVGSIGVIEHRLLGVLALFGAVGVPISVVVTAAYAPIWAAMPVHVVALYLAIGAKSLWQHIQPIGVALATGDLDSARALGARIVTRDLRDASPSEVSRAAVESALENGNDAVFAALFWFVLFGAPGVIAYRLVNTLDAMWGYKSARYLHFGWFAARLDDVMNFVPARLTALTYALVGKTRMGLACWRTQAYAWESPNAGPVMAAGAGALGLELGGAARYHGELEDRPRLGVGEAPGASDIGCALRLVYLGIAAWIVALGLGALLVSTYWNSHA